jgi:hypothetical protein
VRVKHLKAKGVPAPLIIAAMPQRRFPRPWRFEPIPGGYCVIDANGLALAHVYRQPPDAVAFSDKRLTDDEAEKLARLIVRLPEPIELERERSALAKSVIAAQLQARSQSST